MRIPCSFQLGGRVVNVETDDKVAQLDDARGLWIECIDTIRLQSNSGTWEVPEKVMEHAFCHELTHSILDSMGEYKLNKNEKFVDLFATFLHQALTTMKYKGRENGQGKKA